MLHPAPRLHHLPEQAGRAHHQHPTSKRLPVVMTKLEWLWAIIIWLGVTAFMVVAIWLNIGTR